MSSGVSVTVLVEGYYLKPDFNSVFCIEGETAVVAGGPYLDSLIKRSQVVVGQSVSIKPATASELNPFEDGVGFTMAEDGADSTNQPLSSSDDAASDDAASDDAASDDAASDDAASDDAASDDAASDDAASDDAASDELPITDEAADDLTKIKNVGAVAAGVLNEAGIFTFENLIRADAVDLADEMNGKYSIATIQKWQLSASQIKGE